MLGCSAGYMCPEIAWCYLTSVHAGISPKLIGTALTLLGGLSQWLLDHPDRLGPVLMSLSAVIHTHVDTLSRNAATTIYRFCQHTPLAQHLLNAHRPWVEGLLQLYQSSGGVRKRIGGWATCLSVAAMVGC
jgi:hypothetical protein